MPEADWPRFFCVAYYEGEPDYINILLTSFVAETAAAAEVGKRGVLRQAWC